jgi:hypothetical protein
VTGAVEEMIGIDNLRVDSSVADRLSQQLDGVALGWRSDAVGQPPGHTESLNRRWPGGVEANKQMKVHHAAFWYSATLT